MAGKFRGCYVGAAAIACALQGLAVAQNAPSVDTASAGLEEVIVTAQKRAEPVQRVPITIQALTAQAAAQLGINSTDDLGSIIPGLMFKRTDQFAAPSIRGVGSVVLSPGDEGTVAIYVDEVLQVAPTGGVFSLNNIERIEVLKGPQGTLFGRNSTGGVINIATKMPSRTPSADVSVGYGNYNTATSRLYATTGLGEHAAVDIAIYLQHQADGWGRDLTHNTDVYKDREADVRSKLHVEIDDRTSATFAGTFMGSADSRAGGYRLLQGQSSIFGISYDGFYNIESSIPDPTTYNKHYDASVLINHEFDWASLKSISSYQHTTNHWQFDVDATPIDAFRSDLNTAEWAATQELQLVSPQDQRLQWIVGLYYLYANSIFDPGVTSGVLVPAPYETIGGQKTKSIAAFSQATYEILPKLRLTVGVRETSDKRILDQKQEIIGFPAVQQPIEAKTFGKFTYRAALDYRITDDILAFVSETTGFKAGRFNTDTAGQPPIKPENLQAFEIGLKTGFWDRRAQLNVSYFRYDYKDLQTSRLLNGQIVELNAAKARIQGVDVDFNLAPIRNLSFKAAVSYLDAKYTSFPDAVEYVPIPGGGFSTQPFDAAGNELVRAPRWNVVLASAYKVQTGFGDLDFAASSDIRGKFYWDEQNSTPEDRQNMVNASVTWSAPNKHWEVSTWGKNLLDQDRHTFVYPVQLGYISLPSEPRTYGVTFRYRY